MPSPRNNVVLARVAVAVAVFGCAAERRPPEATGSHSAAKQAEAADAAPAMGAPDAGPPRDPPAVTVDSVDPARWRTALSGRAAKSLRGQPLALNETRVPWAQLIHRIHMRVHPVFADSFVPSLKSGRESKTRVELVIDPETGGLVSIGVVDASGDARFDAGALESFSRAFPLGELPAALASSDGRVYLLWEVRSDPEKACSSRFAQPMLLRFD